MNKVYLVSQRNYGEERDELLAVVPTLTLAKKIASNRFENSEWPCVIREVDYFGCSEEASELTGPSEPYMLGFAVIEKKDKIRIETLGPLTREEYYKKLDSWEAMKEINKNEIKLKNNIHYYIDRNEDEVMVYFIAVYDQEPFSRFSYQMKRFIKDHVMSEI